jgi:protein-S-isoprenylcysteine O-methyltransferase Ste14
MATVPGGNRFLTRVRRYRGALPSIKSGVLAIVWTAILGWLVPQGMLVSRFGRHPWSLGSAKYVAMLPLALGAVMCYTAIWNFATVGQGTPAPFDPPRKLVVLGFFRYVRNPIYVGALLIVIGEAILTDALGVRLLFWIAGGFCAVHLFVVFYEEPTLQRKFGDEYEQYLKQVPRWIPRLW